MKLALSCLIACMLLLTLRSEATDRFFSNIESQSRSGRYVVAATSPDNKPNGRRQVFQSRFTYTLKDVRSGKTLWTRQQPMAKPEQGADDSASAYLSPLEGSPCQIYISDSGYTVIYTGWDELIFIDLQGKETGKLDILKDGFTKKENKKYVRDTTAGPIWGWRSHWYFLEAESRDFFVIRPWWSRHLIVELASGSLKKPTKAIREAIMEAEKAYVIKTMQGALDGTIEKCDCCGGPHEAALAAYLAGILKIREAIPALRKLEKDTSTGSSTMGGFEEIAEGRIDPFNYSTYTIRQDMHLALRRLGEKPRGFPCTRFKTEHEDYDKMKPYVRVPVKGTRHANASKLKQGMSPEQVINLLDCPDYVLNRVWQYDIDTDKPYTLTVTWTDDQQVKKIAVIRPALWQQGTVRDRDM